jgi:hypothetical protein
MPSYDKILQLADLVNQGQAPLDTARVLEFARLICAEVHAEMSKPIPMILFCPNGHRHIDEGEYATYPHHTHACQTCGIVWRPAIVQTVGVQFLPGFKNAQ